LEQHPIVIACGKCGVSLSGKVDIGQMQPGLKFEFENADILNNDEKPDYIVECSGEFPTSKHCVEEKSLQYDISPFIKNMSRMSDDGYEKFSRRVQSLIRTANQWNDFKRIIDLAQNGNREYLLQEIRKVFPENIIPCRNEFEIMRAIHMVEVHGFLSPLRGDLLDDLSFSSDILKLNNIELTKLIDYLNNHDGYGLVDLQALIYKVLDDFIKNYQSLIPAFSIQFYQDAAIDYDVEGSSTSDFDSVKQFYLDAYEALGNLMILPVALDNIKYRGNFESVQPINEKLKNLDDFDEEKFRREFESMVEFTRENFPFGFAKSANAKATPRVRFEAIAVGVALALREKPDLKVTNINWINSEEFKEYTTSDASNNEGKLKIRVEYVKDQLLKG